MDIEQLMGLARIDQEKALAMQQAAAKIAPSNAVAEPSAAPVEGGNNGSDAEEDQPSDNAFSVEKDAGGEQD
jgi:hypothetical protein